MPHQRRHVGSAQGGRVERGGGRARGGGGEAGHCCRSVSAARDAAAYTSIAAGSIEALPARGPLPTWHARTMLAEAIAMIRAPVRA